MGECSSRLSCACASLSPAGVDQHVVAAVLADVRELAALLTVALREKGVRLPHRLFNPAVRAVPLLMDGEPLLHRLGGLGDALVERKDFHALFSLQQSLLSHRSLATFIAFLVLIFFGNFFTTAPPP